MANAGGGDIDRTKIPPFFLKLYYRERGEHRQGPLPDDTFNAVLVDALWRGTYTNTTDPIDRPEDFGGSRPPPHLQIWTWTDCTLGELTKLLLRSLPMFGPEGVEAHIGASCVYRLVYADSRSRSDDPVYITKDIGKVIVGSDISNANGAQDDEDMATDDDSDVTLQGCRFIPGDHVCVAIEYRSDNNDTAASPSAASSRPARRESAYDRRSSGYGRLVDRDYAEPPRRHENGYHPYERPYGRRGGRYDGIARSEVPRGDWRRGDIPPGDGGYRGGRSRGRRY